MRIFIISSRFNEQKRNTFDKTLQTAVSKTIKKFDKLYLFLCEIDYENILMYYIGKIAEI